MGSGRYRAMHLLHDNFTSRIGERRLLRALRRRTGAVHVRKDRKGAGWPLAARDWAKGPELAMLLVPIGPRGWSGSRLAIGHVRIYIHAYTYT
jgi:hypothetical protein